MSNDILGSLPRVLPTVPKHRLGLIQDFALKLAGSDGEEWVTQGKQFLRKEPCWVEGKPKTKREGFTTVIIDLPPKPGEFRATSPTLADWLKARERLQKFFTGETVVLRDLFALTDEDLASTTLMPSWRPAGTTNRMAVTWKKKLGVTVFEEMDVMKYTGSEWPKESKLYLVNRSIRPDEDILGENKKTPDQLIQVPDKLWLDLYGYCDADNLHFAITGEHLDPETWTWFPSDRFGYRVANGRWDSRNRIFYFRWLGADYSDPTYGARSAREVSLRKR